MTGIWRDLRSGLRTMRRNPGFTATAIAILGIGVAANATIFSLANALLLRHPPGVRNAAAMVQVGRADEGFLDNVSYLNYVDLRDRASEIADLAASQMMPVPMSLRESSGAQRIFGNLASGNYFEVVGARPALGRLLRSDDAGPVAVLSHRAWRTLFRRSPDVIGAVIRINDHPFTVVGVAEEGFHGTGIAGPDVWVPLEMQSEAMPRADRYLERREANWLQMIGRLREGASPASAAAEMQAAAVVLREEHPRINDGLELGTLPYRPLPAGLHEVAARFMAMLQIVVGIVLVIAAVNVAGMLLAQGARREGELAVRAALGAGRLRLARQLLSENLLLFLLAGVVGLLLTLWLKDGFQRFLPPLDLPIELHVVVDLRVLAFCLSLPILMGLAVGLVPALQASRIDPVAGIQGAARWASPRRTRLRAAMVVGQVALSLLLLVGGGLFLRALVRAGDLDPGFDPEGVEVASLELSLAGFDSETGPLFARDLLERSAALPGITSASLAADLPLDGSSLGLGGVVVPGVDPPDGGSWSADWNVVSEDYFRTLRIPVVRGRPFDATDRPGTRRVAIINETMARRLWPGSDPIGRRFYNGPVSEENALEVVGVARDGLYRSYTDSPRLFVYVPLRQQYRSSLSLLLRNESTASALPGVRELVRGMRPDLPVIGTMALRDYIGAGLSPLRLAASVVGTLGVLGAFLAGLGLYGLTAYGVSQRTREIGVRVALGARPADVLRLVARPGLGLTALGILVGLGGAMALTRFLGGLLIDVSPLDPVTFGVVGAVLLGAAVMACWMPARRALRVQPSTALRHD